MVLAKTTFVEINDFKFSSEILEWRNDEITRLNSINQDIISPSEHKNWLSSKIKSRETMLLMHFFESEPCGLIKLDKLDKNNFGISINLNPEFRGKKLSSLIISKSLHYLIKQGEDSNINILASIKHSNIPSIKSFERSGFKQIVNENSKELLLFKKNLKRISNILFLGYSSNETSLIEHLKNLGYDVTFENTKLENTALKKYDFVISYGYRHILTKEHLLHSKQPPINLHISYLPFNRGSHPNFWAYYDKTPHGVTIHQIDEGIDTGLLLLQKKIELNDDMTLRTSYYLLREEIEKLFIDNTDNLLYSTLKTYRNNFPGSFHLVKDLPKDVDWDLTINQYKDKKSSE
tara:strand:- start:12760 stop:13803 length:1044 start_codon:yes stop_codon:yes gene_type:complete